MKPETQLIYIKRFFLTRNTSGARYMYPLAQEIWKRKE
jgi:hypothetical protein